MTLVASGFEPTEEELRQSHKNVQISLGGKGGVTWGLPRLCLCRMVGLSGHINAITYTMAITMTKLYHP